MTAFFRAAVRHRIRNTRIVATCVRAAFALGLAAHLVSPALVAQQQSAAPAGATAEKPAERAPDALPALPPDAHVDQTMQLGGRTLKYTATVGTIPVYSADGSKKTGEVVFTSYVIEGADRPVTFAFNGGPGASSVYLNFGAIGPKHLAFGGEGDSPSNPVTLVDNPGTWLDFSDLVFIDPIGTGFSRSLQAADQTKKDFFTTDNDIHYLSRVIFDWLVKNQRLRSRKYITGESYGGYRVPRITHYLQTQLGVAMNGVVAVSPYLNPVLDDNADVSPMAWVITLPSIAAANLEREHKLSAESMAPVIDYARGEYVSDLLKGRSDPQSFERLVQKVTDLTGLDKAFVRRSGGRIEIGAYLREIHRERGKIGSVYDSNVTSFDPFPFAPTQRSADPLLESIVAPTTTAMVDFVTRVVGWKASGAYRALSYDVNAQWDFDSAALRRGAVPDLRQAVAADPKLRVLIVHGWNDLSCPFMGSVVTVDQMPPMGDPSRVAVREYQGGHMFYTRPESQAALRKDVQEMFAKH
jgi:carboxypeptidase C (cathepsin A)